MNSPVVSVLMTAYNREPYIAEAIESVLNSTFGDFELIIVDDRSKDRTVEIARAYAAKDSRIRVYVNEKNLGDYPNRNKAASYARGKYLKYLDSDDKIEAFGLAYCIDAMERTPDAALGMISYHDLGSANPVCLQSETIVREHFFSRQHLVIGPTGSIFRRDRFEELGGFDTRFGVASDVFFNTRMAARSPVVLLPQLFFYYREHEGQEKNNDKGYLRFGYLSFKELMEKGGLPLKKEEIDFLSRKLQKRHAVNLTRYLLKSRDWSGFRQVMRETGFSFSDILRGYFR
ncbi:glycosyltransferase family A protein [Puia sp.]|jgi:glycosyltransferase involved in cell wall biosynthesis|uniref:glycosyltransferase family 2 protein n=1 Tax=Puia sp. TaxID=2045100 RepID=UPI002F3F2F4B